MDRNGYNKSILDTENGICYTCGSQTETVRHEIFFGTANRKLSKDYGTWVNVCPFCHQIIHSNYNASLSLKISAERAFKKKYPTKDFKSIFGKYYDI